MLPGNTDFIFDPANVIFLGVFALVLLTVAGTLVDRGPLRAAGRYPRQGGLDPLARGVRGAAGDGEELPPRDDGRDARPHLPARLRLQGLRDARPARGRSKASPRERYRRIRRPGRPLYHRGHAWLKPEEDGTVTIGLDDLASRLVGKPDKRRAPRRRRPRLRERSRVPPDGRQGPRPRRLAGHGRGRGDGLPRERLPAPREAQRRARHPRAPLRPRGRRLLLARDGPPPARDLRRPRRRRPRRRRRAGRGPFEGDPRRRTATASWARCSSKRSP